VIVISDTSTITSLLKIGRISLLNTLFGEVVIPEAVRDELLRYHEIIPGFLRVQEVAHLFNVESLPGPLGRGEAEAIILAEELHADALIIDEQKGRTVAKRRGLRCLGLAALLVMAKKQGLIPSVAQLVMELESKANFYLDGRLKNLILKQAAET
jgi:predicted nucleic acid-binding protein